MVQWDEVVEKLVRITIDKQDIVRDLNEALLDAESFLSETHIVQELICELYGIAGWADTLIDTIKNVVK